MIGFQPELHGDIPQPDEGLDTKNLEKKELFDMVTAVWFLPPYSSKGITRDYLLKVNRNAVFRVNTNELKRFEVDLSKECQKKIGTINNALLVRKLNMLASVHKRGKSWDSQSTRYQSRDGCTEWRGTLIKPTSWKIFERPVRPEASSFGTQSNACARDLLWESECQ